MSPGHSQGQAEHLGEQLHGWRRDWRRLEELTRNEGGPAPAAAPFYTILGWMSRGGAGGGADLFGTGPWLWQGGYE